MMTLHEIQKANVAALAWDQPAETEFDWRGWYWDQREAFVTVAHSWRRIAHTAALAGDHEVVRMAHGYAMQNEMWAKDAERKARLA